MTKRKADEQQDEQDEQPVNTHLPDDLVFENVPNTLKMVSVNVSGLHAALKKDLARYVTAEDADILMLQETKLNAVPSDVAIVKTFKGYPYQVWSHSTSKKGYAGTAVLSKIKPISVNYGVGDESFDTEGRYITLEFEGFYLVASYVPNAGSKLERLDPKHVHYLILTRYLEGLQSKKPIVWAGDLNVAHKEVDLARPKTNSKTPGFTPLERSDFDTLLKDLELVDSFRSVHPNTIDRYSYYSYRFACRSKNLGWRLDYFVLSKTLMNSVVEADIRSHVYGFSDHCPVLLILNNTIA